jgi:hypothetical protein
MDTPNQSAYSHDSDTSACVNQEEFELERREQQSRFRQVEEFILE